MSIKEAVKLLAWIIACNAVGIIGGMITAEAVPHWYSSLEKPPLTPPSWVFGPVWIALYSLMGVSAWLYWKRDKADEATRALLQSLFLVQLALNGFWSPVFFGLKWMAVALIIIISLVCILLALILLSIRKDFAAAGYLLIPYLLWVSFASYLNTGFLFLNH